MTLKTIFDTCEPRADVLSGNTKDEHFAADLAKVINGTAPAEYATPQNFFSHTHPTRGIKTLLDTACRRLSGAGNEVASIIRLGTQYGGGKTHGLIALVHAARGGHDVDNIQEFVSRDLLPKGNVRVASFDGDSSDPANGLKLEGGIYAHTPWGQIAYQLAGRSGFDRLQNSDKTFAAPGSETLKELFGSEPTLIVLDEIAVYLRKAEQAHPGSAAQFPSFIRALIKAVSDSPQAVLVYTLAAGREGSGHEAENTRALEVFSEAERESARSATTLNPTEDDETADVLKRRLFAKVDINAADSVIEEYAAVWRANKAALPEDVQSPEMKDQFRRGYPLHPELLDLLTEKTSTLGTFQRTRGMLRLLAKTIYELWRAYAQDPSSVKDIFSIQTHHIDLGADPIRSEVLVKLEQSDYAPALKGDVESTQGDSPALAQQLDDKFYPGQAPVVTFIARTVFLNTLAYGSNLKGISQPHLLYSVCSPGLEPSFVEQARRKFVEESLYLDDNPGVPMRFQIQPNLNQMIQRLMRDVDPGEAQNYLNATIKDLYSRSGGNFELISFPGGPYEVPDEVGDGRPLLVIHSYDALSISGDPREIPADVGNIYQFKGVNNEFRQLRNNLVFLVADERQKPEMKERVRRRIALQALDTPEKMRELAEHQQQKVKEELEKSKFNIAQSVLACYRHLFYPSHNPMSGSTVPLAHTSMEKAETGDRPGEGQKLVTRYLREEKKLLQEGDAPTSPNYVKDNTPLKISGFTSTQELRMEFRRAQKLPIILGNEPFVACVKQGIDLGQFVLKVGDQVWGKGEAPPFIQINENEYVYTADKAKEEHIWPRPDELKLTLRATPENIAPGQKSTLAVDVTGGIPPYVYTSSLDQLTRSETSDTTFMVIISPATSQDINLKVTDKRGTVVTKTITITVQAGPGGGAGGSATGTGSGTGGSGNGADPDPTPPPPPTSISADGQLATALQQLGDKARSEGIDKLSKISIRFIDWSAGFRVQQALGMLQDLKITARYDSQSAPGSGFLVEGDGIETMRFLFAGTVEKANKLKPFLDNELRNNDAVLQPVYDLSSSPGISTDPASMEKLIKDITKFGAGEAYVEAWAAQQEELV